MKKLKFICLAVVIAILLVTLQFNTPIVRAAQTWTTWNLPFENGTIRVIVPNALANAQSRISWLVEMADRSTVTTNPLNQDLDGLISPGDIIVCTNKMLMWFDLTNDGSGTTNGGGGMLRGLWQLHLDGSNNLNFKRIINAYNYSPNLLYAGSKPGLQGSGISFLGNFGANVDNGVTWGIEHEQSPVVTPFTGVSISSVDNGPYHNEDGVFVQIQGRIGSGILAPGIDSRYDTDARAGYIGSTTYTLTYRIPASLNEFKQEISLNVVSNNFGLLGTAVISNNLAGYDEGSYAMKLVADPELVKGKDSAPAPYEVTIDTNTYFSLSGYNLKFYNEPFFTHPNNVYWMETSAGGNGKLAGIGGPNQTYKVPFYVIIPEKSSMPAFYQNNYRLQCIDNPGGTNKCNALDLQLFDSSRTGQYTWTQGSNINQNMTVKLIDSN